MDTAFNGPDFQRMECLNPLQEKYVNLAVRAIACEGDGRGLVVAPKSVVRSLRAIDGLRHVPGLTSHIAEFSAAIENLIAWDKLPTHWRSAPSLTSTSAAYSLWFQKLEENHGTDASAKIRAALGLIFAGAFGRQAPIADWLAKSALTLIHSGKSSRASSRHWREMLEKLEFLNGSLRNLAETSPHLPTKEFVTQLLALLDTELVPVELDAAPNRPPPEVGQDNPAPSAASHAAPSANQDAEEESFTPGSLVIWQAKRAERARAELVAGLVDWSLLAMEDLEPVTRRVESSLETEKSSLETENSAFSILAIICLNTCLPPRIALELPLGCNGDLWLSAQEGGVWWARSQIALQEAIEDVVLQHGHQPGQDFFIPLPADAAVKLLEFVAKAPGATTLGHALFSGIADYKDILKKFGLFLRNNNVNHDEHIPYSARYSYTGGEAIFRATGNPFLSGVPGLDLRHLAFGEANYICISHELVREAYAALYKRLGFAEPVQMPATGYVGSKVCPTSQTMRTALKNIRKDIEQSLSGIAQRTELSQVLDGINDATTGRCAAVVIATLHRGYKVHRMTMGDLYSDPNLMNLHDKITSLLITRIIEKTQSTTDLLDGHRRDMFSIATRIEKLDPKAAAKLRKIATLEKPGTPAFFHLILGKRGVTFRPLRTKDIRAKLLALGMAINGGRHFFITEAVTHNIPAILLRVITGHGRSGGQPFNFAGVSPPTK